MMIERVVEYDGVGFIKYLYARMSKTAYINNETLYCLFLCFLSGSERLGENGVRSVTVSPQSMCSSGADSGVDSYDLPTMAISLCGGLTENREITKGAQTRPQTALHITYVQQESGLLA